MFSQYLVLFCNPKRLIAIQRDQFHSQRIIDKQELMSKTIKLDYLCLTLIVVLSLCNLTMNQLPPDEQKLVKDINQTLGKHLVTGSKWGMKFHFYKPGLTKYGPYQWLWDSSFHMISWSHLNFTNSILDLQTMLQKQNRNTLQIPQMIFWGKQSLKDLVLNRLFFTDPTVTDISQMPMLSFALQRIYKATKDKDLLQKLLPRLIEYHQWWKTHRQPDADGKIVIIHPWQSGLDASPMYDEALKVNDAQPTLKQLYPKFEELQLSYRFKYNWKTNKIIAKKEKSANPKFLDYFVMKQVGVNSVYTAGWKIYKQLSLQIGNFKLADYCQKQYNHFLKGLLSFYDPSLKRYTSEYLDKDQFKRTRANTVQGLFPILITDLPSEHKDVILSMLRDQNHYKSDFPIPTVSRSDPAYQPVFTIDLMWRGPSWAAPNFFILQGLRNHNQKQLYQQIGGKWVKQAINHGIWQMWNPQNGTGYGVKGLGMSTSVIDVVYGLEDMHKFQDI